MIFDISCISVPCQNNPVIGGKFGHLNLCMNKIMRVSGTWCWYYFYSKRTHCFVTAKKNLLIFNVKNVTVKKLPKHVKLVPFYGNYYKYSKSLFSVNYTVIASILKRFLFFFIIITQFFLTNNYIFKIGFNAIDKKVNWVNISYFRIILFRIITTAFLKSRFIIKCALFYVVQFRQFFIAF